MPKFYGQNKKRKDPRYFLNETVDQDLVQDPIGGTVRPDQLGTIVIRDLEHCLELAQSGLFNFSSILKNVLLRLEAIKSNED